MLLIKNIGTLQTPVGSCKHGGEKQGENLKLHDAAILVENGLIKAITEGGILPESCENAEVIDAQGALVTYRQGMLSAEVLKSGIDLLLK